MRIFDTLSHRLLRLFMPGYSGDSLAQRIQRGAFTLAMLLVGVLGLGILILQVIHVRTVTLAAHQITLQALRDGLANQIDGIADELRFLSRSPLVWTAISDSAGRDAYLRPYLRSQSELNHLTRLTLLDYRGRLIAGGQQPLDPASEVELRLPMQQAQRRARPVGHVSADGSRLILAFPVVYPYSRDVIGILLGEAPLRQLMQARIGTLGAEHGLVLRHGERELFVHAESNGRRYLSLATPLLSQKVKHLYAFELELFEHQPKWLLAALPTLAVYLALAALLVGFTWHASHRLAAGLTQRLERLATAVARGGDPAALPEDPEQDEIGLLTRVLKDSLRANHALTSTLEERVARRTGELAASEAQYRFLAENIKDLVWLLDVESMRLLYVSPSVQGLMGFSAEELTEARLDVVLQPRQAEALKALIRDRAEAFRAGTAPHDRYYQNEVEQPIKGGGSVWTEVITCYRTDERSGRILLLGVTRDISQRRRAEEMERYAAFQAGIAEMGVSVLHHIGNAITSVNADAEALCKASADLTRVAELLEHNASDEAASLARAAPSRADAERQLKIEREAAAVIRRLYEEGLKARGQRIADSVRHIANIVRLQQNAALPDVAVTSFELDEVMRDVLALHADTLKQNAIEVELSLDADLPHLSLPRNQLQQALMHLTRNACKAIKSRPPGAPPGRIRIRGERLDAQYVQVNIIDNGIGLDAAGIEAAFHVGGAGLGLHSTALFVQSIGGRVSLHSDGPGQGARLLLVLPCVSQAIAVASTEVQHASL